MPVFNNMLAGASGATGGEFAIERSIRLNAPDSSFLNRTPSSAGNRKTWTWSGWVKRSAVGTKQIFLGVQGSSDTTYVENYFATDDKLYLRFGYTSVAEVRTTQVFRDVASWMHIVIAFDVTQSSDTNKLRLYINGSQVDDFSTDTRSSFSNQDYGINRTGAHKISGAPNGSSDYLDAYLADVHFVDGQALAPTDFGAPDDNGVWQPIKYAGTYGTNGFHLDFKDNSSNAALGTDTSGNSNTWTVNNLTASTSPDYSLYVSGPVAGSPYDATKMFDGSLTTYTDHSSANSTITWTYTIANVTSLRVYIHGGNSTNTVTTVGGNGTQTDTISTNFGPGWHTISLSSTGSTINSIAFTRGGSGNPLSIYAIEVNSVVYIAGGSHTDSLVDTPNNGTASSGGDPGGSIVGNYATLNPLDNNGLTLSNGNLDASRATNSWATCKATFGLASDKWYFEYTVNSGASNQIIGVFKTEDTPPVVGTYGYMTYSASGWGYQLDGNKANSNSFTATGTTAGVGDNIMVAVDVGAGKIWFGVNGTWLNSGNPANGSNAAFTNLSGSMSPAVCLYGTQSGSINFGSRAFAYAAPSGYKSLNTANLDPPTIADPSKYFDTKLWTGNSVDNRVISGLNMDPDMVWIKARSQAGQDSPITDIVRGVNKPLMTNVGYAESNNDYGAVGNFGTNSFTIKHGPHATYGKYQVNLLNQTYVGWAWNAGTSTVTNNDGTIASSVRASAASGFSIVTWTGNGQNNASVGHGLNAPPSIVIIKNRSSVTSFHTYVRALDSTGQYQLYLDGTQASTNFGSPFFNTDSTKINLVGGSSAGINASGNFVAWCFAPVANYSHMGSFLGNANSDGPFVALSFRPAFIFIKNASLAGSNWIIIDSTRDTYNEADHLLKPNKSDQEQVTTANEVDLLSNGFKPRGTDGDTNGNGNTMIYYAIAENPFQANGGLAR